MKQFGVRILLVVGIILCLLFAKPIIKPIINTIKCKETVTSVIDKIESSALNRLRPNMQAVGFYPNYPDDIILVGLKEERVLEVYAASTDGVQLIKSYPFTAYSGQLGPKLQEGDRQIPEGIYQIEYLNPNSAFYLSMKVDYPNDFDKKKTTFSDVSAMGGDIFIHGKSATIGCIPIGDEAIEEVFLLTQKAMNNPVKVIISPRDFRKNDAYPAIASVDWETELYDQIKEELLALGQIR